jgi:hypothetical protein
LPESVERHEGAGDGLRERLDRVVHQPQVIQLRARRLGLIEQFGDRLKHLVLDAAFLFDIRQYSPAKFGGRSDGTPSDDPGTGGCSTAA